MTVPEIALPKLLVVALKLRVDALLIRVLAMSLFKVDPVNACFTTALFCRSVNSLDVISKFVLIDVKLSLNPCELLFTPGIG